MDGGTCGFDNGGLSVQLQLLALFLSLHPYSENVLKLQFQLPLGGTASALHFFVFD